MKTRTRRTGGSISVIIPAAALRRLGIGPDEDLGVEIGENALTLRPLRSAIADVIAEWRRDPLIPDAADRPDREEVLRSIDESRDTHLDRSYLGRPR